MDLSQIRSNFPALQTEVYGKRLVYLDNAATAQRPLSVIRKWEDLSEFKNANIHRAVHALSSSATNEYENTREAVKAFLCAPSDYDVIFTSGTTESINLVARSFGDEFIGEGDEIILSPDSHHSNIVPWQMLAGRKKAVIKLLELSPNGYILPESVQKVISPRTKIVAISHISNVLGLVNPVREIVNIAHSHGVPVLVDGAQGAVHARVDISSLGCDFYAFSGHKLYAATGTGVLCASREWLEKMPPFLGGGEMIASVSLEKGTSYAPSPMKFEAGTQNFNSVPTLVPAMEFALECFENKEVIEEQNKITEYLLEQFDGDKRIKLYGVPCGTAEKVPLFSIAVEGAHHEDLALLLDKMGVAVRSGQMCAEPLMDRLGVTGLLRASFAPYNTLEEAKIFIEALHRAINMLV